MAFKEIYIGTVGFYLSTWIMEITRVFTANELHTWKWKLQPVTIYGLIGNQNA